MLMRLTLVVIVVLASVGAVRAEEPAATVDYVRDVKPLLMRHCYACHGALRQEGNVRLDTGALIRAGGDSGPTIAAGKSAESLLITVVTRSENRMPAEGEPLAEAQVDVLRRWIDSGALAPEETPPPDPRKHWAFQKPARPDLPTTDAAATMANPVDAFLTAAREKAGLAANPPADKRTLARRVYLDLIGIPPTGEELQAFLDDDAPDAYERLVDALLARPQYGERWARHWMDIWRYSDWAGYGKEVRDSQQHIWRWRDWIVESLNADRGYDRMIVDMLAGDEVAPEDPDTLRATGYLARSWYKFNRNVWLDNIVEHTGKAFLGVTLNCARCHSHMYDPISHREYYQFRAIFETHDVRTDRAGNEANLDLDGVARVYDAHHDRKTFLFVRGQESQPKEDELLAPGVPAALGGDELRIQPIRLPAPAYNTGLQSHVRSQLVTQARAAVAKAKTELTDAQTKLVTAQTTTSATAVAAAPTTTPADLALLTAAESLATKHLAAAAADLASLDARIAADNARYATPPAASTAALTASAAAAVSAAAICAAEESLLAAEQKIAALPPAEGANEKAQQERKKVEEALAAAKQKLVTVRAEADSRADYPPLDKLYPTTSTGRRVALARWIASRNNPLAARVAINHIWLRHFGEPLVPSVFDFGLNGKLPVNPELLDWLAVEFMDRGWSMKAMHRLIVTSQAYRMRSTSDANDPRRALDPDNRLLWRANLRRMEAETVRDSVLAIAGQLDLARGGPDLDHAEGLKSHRRSLYFRHANEKQMTFLKLFDAASVNECYRRSESVVPQQALALANSPLALEQSRRLATQLWQQASAQPTGADERFVREAYERVLGRGPTGEECSLSLKFLAAQAARLADAAHLTPFVGGDSAAIKPADDPHMRAREDLVHVLLNHNDFVTIR